MLMPRYSDQDNHSENNFIGKQYGHVPTTVAAHTKMRLLSKVEQNMRQNQQNQNPGHSQSINKLINTAATGNGLVGDVDELLTPMRVRSHVPNSLENASSGGSASSNSGDSSWCSSSSVKEQPSCSRPERNLWSRAEMLEMLTIMERMNALEQLNDRNVKSEHVFRQIEEEMCQKGFMKKSSVQIWTKWKFLKSTYNTAMRQGNGIPKVVPEDVYRMLCQMLHKNVSCKAKAKGAGIKTKPNGNSEQGVNGPSVKALPKRAVCKEELGVGMEHPIFGFRLGMVKAEPIDTGYEPTVNQINSSEQHNETVDFVRNGDSSQDHTSALELMPLVHTPIIVSVKHEPEMDLGMDSTNTPPPTAPTSPSPPPACPERRDSEDKEQLNILMPPLSTPATPLRVAAFAMDAQRHPSSTPLHGVLQIERPTAPLSKSASNLGAGKGNRTMPLHSTSNINFVHPTSKLMLPRKQLSMRIPREISVQPANSRALKPVPIRDTGYSLRPDRMIPDLEQSISPPQSPSPPMQALPVAKNAISYASTSRQAQLLGEQQQQQQQPQPHPMRKRRLNCPSQSPVPVKLQRSSALYEAKQRNDELPPAVEEQNKSKQASDEGQRRKQRQEELFKSELSQLASAMRTAQKEMLESFFQQQKELARREHEFQLRQDNLVMSALRKQTDALLRTARDLMNTNEDVECSQSEADEQRESKTNESDMLLVEPEIELRETSKDNDEDEDEPTNDQQMDCSVYEDD
ncbi:hypothetical protein KR222_005581, partial [Zaprionus bogoriensis]